MHSGPDGELPTSSKEWLACGLHAASLISLALVHPLLDLLAQFPEFFITHGATKGDILFLAAGLCLILPALVLATIWSLRGVPGSLSFVTILVTTLCLAALLIQLLGNRFGGGTGLVLIAGLGGIAGAFSYLRWESVRAAFQVLWLSLLLTPAIFLWRVPIWGSEAVVSETSVESDTPIVFVVFDELPLTTILGPDGGIDAVRFPNFAALAETSHWFPNATTVSEGTLISIPALLDGKYPQKPFALPTLDGHPRSLFTLLAGSHNLNIHENLTRLSPVRRDLEFSERWGTMLADLKVVGLHLWMPVAWTGDLAPITESWTDFGPSQPKWGSLTPAWQERTRRFEDFLASITVTDPPSLHFLHSMFPHASWKFLPDGRRYVGYEPPGVRGIDGSRGQKGGANIWLDDPWVVTQGLQRHALQVGFVDKLVGRLVQRLRETGLFDRSLVVMTADHGSAFQAGLSRRRITKETAPEILSIPLFVKLPGQTVAVHSDRNVETIDVLPTILDALDVDVDWSLDGSSVLSGPERPEKIAFSDRGDRWEFSHSLPGLRQILSRNQEQIGGGDWSSLFRAGDRWGLIGRRVTEFESVASDSPDRSVGLKERALLEQVSHRDLFIPSLLEGHITGPWPVEAAIPLAVALNGKAEAVTWTSPGLGGNRSFRALISPRSLREGHNAIEVFRLVTDDAEVRLEKISQHDSGFEIVGERRGTHLKRTDGNMIPIRASGVPGWVVSGVDPESGLLWVGGWTVDAVFLRLVDEVVVFADNQLVARGATQFERSEGATWLGLPELSSTGFHMDFKLSDSPIDTEIRVFALSEGRAVELIYPRPESEHWVFHDNPRQAAPQRPGKRFETRTIFPGGEGDDEIFISGWSVGEGAHRWTSAAEAVLAIQAPEAGTELNVKILARPFLVPGKLERQRVRVRTTEPLGEWTLAENNELTFEFRLNEKMGNNAGVIAVYISLPDAESPEKLEINGDPRKLGLALTRIDLVPALAGKQ